ncbi:helix-turn-helix transcriptional regulator [Brevibacillus laterosporus]|uniref:Helix-turn-helix transcriptional regulator n=1 Tax=Brevibacillus laterosporus TaxID=1465 RepID=A0AAP3DLI5_BRELA|nr:helix-turn-helix transcriptional regulator [Brevibacillus laterosporus]MCG7319621.1 helix-turn-helix transcriptional regulator [Brevibacillus laterosporus]MCR8982900.1 helix-turn-helix transcriptional regulator [Brevibacillus laterosporus]MCZ0810056.1 helix-turn-helix transcriptional regulator [Brevibacillus laterosporus]MCZ0828680.1 helix-turn-helix transcriptional regulator [Brevibacillus laterosporus]MCZ0853153.1 helix-turn-helix transcriptional regulator [Brevibacillus laterosporus]
MIRCRLGDIMQERGYLNKDVVEKTGISRNTITSLSANATKQVHYDTINALCKGLGVLPADLFEYIDDEEKK